MRGDRLFDYLEWMRLRRLSRLTTGDRMYVLRMAQEGVGKPLHQADVDDLRRWWSEHSRPLAAGTAYNRRSHLRCFFRWAIDEGLTRDDPTRRLPVVRRPRYLPRPIPDEDIAKAFANLTDPRTRACVALGLFAGLRCVEIARLDREDVLDTRRPPVLVVHGKGDKERIVPIGPALLAELRAYELPRRGPVIQREDGRSGHLAPNRVSSLIGQHLHDVGIGQSAHSLRHAYACKALAAGGDIEAVSELLGHSSTATTRSYARWSQDRLSEIVGRVDGVFSALTT
ncbi:MAG TPA: tyrosine-type recombinase/integrase [Nocardioidaceae bacterium]|nr:tyrosine-type recombinase/integrase [Nocardioidaceae bacterium]